MRGKTLIVTNDYGEYRNTPYAILKQERELNEQDQFKFHFI